MIDKKYILECSCGNPTHLCIVHYYKDEDSVFNTIDIYFTSNYHVGFFERLKYGLKYIFFKRSMNISDSVMLNEDELYKLDQFIKDYRRETFE